MVTVLVTRLMPFAGSLIEKLEHNGYDVMHESLLSIEPLYYRRPSLPSSSKPIVALTSRVAPDVMSTRYDEVEDLLNQPCYCIGDKTAEDAKAFGFTDVINSNSNETTLADMILGAELFKNPILHIGGEDIDIDPQELLAAAGWKVMNWPVYKSIETEDLSEHTTFAFKNRKIDIVVLYSVRVAQIFAKMVKRYELEDYCKHIKVVGLDHNTTQELHDLTFKSVHTANKPTEDELIKTVLKEAPTTGGDYDKARQQSC